jgi:hypothetical protein
VFVVCDAGGACLNDTVFITVLPLPNQPPIIVNDFYTLVGNTLINDNFLLNDSDPDGFLVVTLSPIQDVLYGVLVYDALGSFTYTPNIGFAGLDTAIIKICDNDLACSFDTLFFEVTTASILPIVNNESFTLNEDASLNGNVIVNDFSNQGNLSATLISGPSNGNINVAINGQFTYTPNPNFNGIDTVITSVCDVNGVCINDTLFFNVLPVTDPLIVNNENFIIPFNASFSNNILTNDIDVDGTLSATVPQVDGPANGSFTSNTDGSFTCTLFMPHEGENSFENLKDKDTLEAYFAEHFPDTAAVIPDLVEDFFKNPTSYLVTMKCFPWTFEDKVALIGDACHAIVPFYGQGMNAGFEDITVLHEMITLYGNDWDKIFNEYEKSRKPNADAIAELSYRNFMEMSTKTADAKFLLQKKIEKWFSEKHPDKWLPLYSRVTFSLRPYSEALALGNQQNAIMDQVMQLPHIESIWNSEVVENKILELLG